MDLTASKSKQATAILIGEQTAKNPLFHVKQFINDFYKEMEEEEKETKLNDDELDVFRKAFRILHECNEWIKEDDERNKKERPTFNKGSRIIYTIEDENGNTHTVTRLSKRCYELKECKTLFVTDDEGVVTGIYKEK